MSKKTYELLFKGFIKTKNKKSIEKIKGRTDFKTFDDIKDEPEFGGIFNDGIIMVDVDDSDQAEVLYKIVNDLNINCVVIQTGRGKHFYFKNNEVKGNKNRTNTAISIVADMKMGQTSYGVVKMDGKFRNILKASEELDMLPKWLFPINHKINFFDLEVGDRNQSLFNYILTLQSEAFTVEEARETIRLINRYILKEPLEERELEIILRDEAFLKPVFYQKNKFMHNVFGDYLKRDVEDHIIWRQFDNRQWRLSRNAK